MKFPRINNKYTFHTPHRFHIFLMHRTNSTVASCIERDGLLRVRVRRSHRSLPDDTFPLLAAPAQRSGHLPVSNSIPNKSMVISPLRL